MSVRLSEIESAASEAQQIAEQTTAKDYFLSQEEKLVDEWADKSVKLFKYALPDLGSQEKCSRASTSAGPSSWSTSTPTSTRSSTTKAASSSRPTASSTARYAATDPGAEKG